MRRTIVLSLLAACACACSNVCWSDDAARATAIRYVRDRPPHPVARSFYVVVDGDAPSPRFMNCLAADSLLIAASPLTHDFAAHRLRPGADTQRVTLWVSDYDQTGEDHGSIRAGYYGGDAAGESFALALERRGGDWVVAGQR